MRKNFITIGSFDGVHTGHRHLIFVLKDLADLKEMKSLVFAFEYPPRVVMSENKNMSILTMPEEKFKILKELAPHNIVKLKFDEVKNYTREEFFNILLTKYNMGGLLVGKDFAFGKDRSGHLDFLRKACKENNVFYTQAEFVQEGGHKVSSSVIRKALKDGDITSAGQMLSRPYQISGKIIKGRQLGRKMGFPTANLDINPLKILPRGVFAVKAYLGKKVFNGVGNIGIRPTVESNGLPSVEVHLLGFDGNIYGRILTVDFIDKIRDEKKFNTLGELTEQINKDSKTACDILK